MMLIGYAVSVITIYRSVITALEWAIEFIVTRVFVALLPHTPRSFQRFVLSIRISLEAVNLWGYTSEADALNKEAAKKLARAERQVVLAQQCNDMVNELIAERDALR